MKQEAEMIDRLYQELYANNYSLMEKVIEEYVLNLNPIEMNELETYVMNYTY
jgi:hypothetical protein